jgi:hypothetical protein
MKLDPGMHIGLHLVFFGKSGVTARGGGLATCACRAQSGAPPPRARVLVRAQSGGGPRPLCLYGHVVESQRMGVHGRSRRCKHGGPRRHAFTTGLVAGRGLLAGCRRPQW